MCDITSRILHVLTASQCLLLNKDYALISFYFDDIELRQDSGTSFLNKVPRTNLKSDYSTRPNRDNRPRRYLTELVILHVLIVVIVTHCNFLAHLSRRLTR